MSHRAKYIIVGRYELPIVFSDLMKHSEVAGDQKVVSAGFCYVKNDLFECYGESASLKVESRGKVDAEILNKMLGQSHDD